MLLRLLDGNESKSVPAGMHSLSREILLRIIDFLRWKDVLVGRAVCTQWRDMSRLATPRVVAHSPGQLSSLLAPESSTFGAAKDAKSRSDVSRQYHPMCRLIPSDRSSASNAFVA